MQLEKTCPSATLSTTDPIWPDRGLKLGCHDGKPASNCLSYGTAYAKPLGWLEAAAAVTSTSKNNKFDKTIDLCGPYVMHGIQIMAFGTSCLQCVKNTFK
jgi:hypothetical protein